MDGEQMHRLMAAEPYLDYLGLDMLDAQAGSVMLLLRLRPEVTNVPTSHRSALALSSRDRPSLRGALCYTRRCVRKPGVDLCPG